MTRARLIAFYLPQFHPIPENDEWWGPGFTEWTNVARARPLFPGHYQPHIPADLGFYDLRVPETRAAQAELARQAGIEGFCYWHYWFGGRRLLERPFSEVLESGEPDFPFCLAWANQTWTGIWHGAPNRTLIEQTYPGPADHERHFYSLLPAFLDPRHIRIDRKPVFVVYDPLGLPDAAAFVEQWRTLANRNGLPGIHFVAHMFRHVPTFDPLGVGFDSITVCRPNRIAPFSKVDTERVRQQRSLQNGSPLTTADVFRAALFKRARSRVRRWQGFPPGVFDYADAAMMMLEELRSFPAHLTHPCVLPNWDNSPRSGSRALILNDSTPDLFRIHLREALEYAEAQPAERRIVFVKSWNEWAEGNYLEPDHRFGREYLDVVRSEVVLSSNDKRLPLEHPTAVAPASR